MVLLGGPSSHVEDANSEDSLVETGYSVNLLPSIDRGIIQELTSILPHMILISSYSWWEEGVILKDLYRYVFLLRKKKKTLTANFHKLAAISLEEILTNTGPENCEDFFL